MQKRVVSPGKVIGEGGFGVVTEEGNLARKHFKKLTHLVRELTMLRYMRSSGYIVKVEKNNFMDLSICCRKWSCSLYDAILKETIELKEKLQIFQDVLHGLCHMHQAGLVHSDVTLSNILVNKKTWRACLCDLGLSSITNYSRVKQTARGYAPENPVPCQGHDMFGLTVCMIDLFGGVMIRVKKNAAQLRQIIKTNPNIPNKLRPILCKMCPDDPCEAISSAKVLWDVFQQKTSFPLPEVDLYKVTVPEKINLYLREQMKALSETYKINRGQRCYRVLVQFFSSPHGSQVDEKYYDLYMMAAMFIFASLYGESHFNEVEALECLRNEYDHEEFLEVVELLVQDNNFIASALVSAQ